MALITNEDIAELQNKLDDLKNVKESKEAERTASLEDSTRTFEDITNRTEELNKVKSDIELNAKLQEDLSKLVDEKENLLNTTIDSEKANSASREALQIKLDTSFKDQDAKTFDKKEKEEKKADLEMTLTSHNETLAKMQTEYDAMADGPEKDDLKKKMDDLQATADGVANSIAAETTAIAALQAELDALSTSIEADNAAMKALEMEHKAIAELLSKTEVELVDAKVAKKEATETGSDMATEKQTIEDNLTALNADYSKIKDHVKSLDEEISEVEKQIKNVEESDLLEQFEEEQTTRKNHARETLANRERIKPLLVRSNEDVQEELSDFNSDSSIFIKDIKEELEFTSEAEDTMEEVSQHFADSERFFRASEAYTLSQRSLFDIDVIVGQIKNACSRGQTHIQLDSDKITGTQILMLNKAGYKITHAKKGGKGVGSNEILITIDWGFHPGAS